MTDREKTLVELHKQFLHLHYKVAEYEMAGLAPPEHLLKKFEDVQRKVQIISKALAN
jgi:beta-galactosidase beta subunit